MLASDFGDAPDTSAGTGAGNYQTLSANSGPSHVIDATQTKLFMGARVDSEANGLQNVNAIGDDVATLPDDEDGLVEPSQDLLLTAGSVPTVRVRATNTTGSAATLYGWIDYNRDGVFDNATERASVSVPNGSNKSTFTLAFPTVPTSADGGATFARFRLGSDSAAANSTGASNGGEVEDYKAFIFERGGGVANAASTIEISEGINGGPSLGQFAQFGSSAAAIGDLNGDGVMDLAVGARYDEISEGIAPGSVYVQFMNANGTVKSALKISSNLNGGPALSTGDYFGSSIAAIGDIDGDGTPDVAVGAEGFYTGTSTGAIYILRLNSNGTVKSHSQITVNTPSLNVRFGSSVTAVGDLDGDGVTDLAVGADFDDYRGSVHVLLLNSNATVKASTRISSGTNGGPTFEDSSHFGSGVTSLGDLNGDGITDIAVGASYTEGGGAAHILFLNANGTAKSSIKLADGANGVPDLANYGNFGAAVSSLGDLDGDGVTDLAVGTSFDSDPGDDQYLSGSVSILLLNANGTVKSSSKITRGLNGGPTFTDEIDFGAAIAPLGDLNGDGIGDLFVGAPFGLTLDEYSSGAGYVLFLRDAASSNAPTISAIDDVTTSASTATEALEFTVGDLQTPAASLTLSASSSNTTLVPNQNVTFGGSGANRTVTVTPAADQAGIATITITVTDGQGQSSTSMFDVTVSSNAGFSFDFAAVGSNLHPTLRYFGQTSLSAAPFQIIRYGTMTLSGITGFPQTLAAAGNNPENITMEFGSRNPAAPVEVVTLDTFDNGLSDGLGNQTYRANGQLTPANAQTDIPTITIFNSGVAVAQAKFLELSLDVTTSGTVTSQQSRIQVTQALGADPTIYNEIIAKTGNGIIPIGLNVFDFGGTIAGFGDAEIFRSSGQGLAGFTLVDDFGDDIGTASTWNRQADIKGRLTINDDGDYFAVSLQAGQSYTFQTVLRTLGDSSLRVLNSAGTEIAYNDDVSETDLSSKIVLTPTSSGTFYLVVDGFGGQGSYTLKQVGGVVAPTVAVNIVDASLSDSDSSSSVTFTFSEAVNGFTIADVTAAGGTLSSFTGSGSSYSATFTATDGVATTGSVSVGTGYTNGAGTAGTAGSDTVTIDRLNPTVTVNIVDASLSDGDSSSSVTFTFSEAVTGFTVADVTVAGGTLSDFAGSGSSYSATFTATDGSTTTGSVSVGTGYTDAVGNVGTAGSDTVGVDRANPTVTVNVVDVSLSDTDNSSSVTFTFSEAVTGFTAADVSVAGGALSAFAGSGSSYTATFTATNGVATTGSVSVGTGYTDAAGNSGGTGSDTVVIDTLNPTVTVNIVDTVLTDADNASVVTFTFSEAVTGFTAADVTVSSGTLSAFSGAGASYTATFTATNGVAATGSVAVGTGYTDAAGNVGVAGSDTVTIDTTDGVDVTINLTGTQKVVVRNNGANLEVLIDDVLDTSFSKITAASVQSITVVGGAGNNLIDLSNVGPSAFSRIGGVAAVVQAGAGNDTVIGSQFGDQILGEDGNDSLNGAIGDDTVTGGAGVDTMTGGAGTADILSESTVTNLTLIATTLTNGTGGTAEVDSHGEFERAMLLGVATANVLDASAAGIPVTLFGGNGNDLLIGGTLADNIDGQGGNDTVAGNGGPDSLIGGAGNDTLRETVDQDLTLTNTTLTASGNTKATVVDNLTTFEIAEISGGVSRNKIDLSGFTASLGTTINGGGQSDTIFGSPGPDVIFTLTGNDSISGLGGADVIVSGNGNDTISGGDGADNLNGQNGNDLVLGDADNDVVVGGAGIDTLNGGAGNDFVAGQADAGLLSGGDGNDTVQGNTANDTLNGDAGDDRLFGLQGDDVLNGGDGVDSLVGAIGNDSLNGGAGTDTLQGDLGNDTLDGGADFDRINEVFDTNVTIVGIAVSTTAFGNDSVVAIERIQISGGPGNNLLDARLATVPVFLSGGLGNDTVLGGSKADGIDGGDGDDVVSGGAGGDIILGGGGFDYWLEKADTNFTITGQTVSSAATGGETVADAERIVLIGGNSANTLNASTASVPVVLIGGTGNDTLIGGASADTLSGGNRNDSGVTGADGTDSLDGGGGADVLETDAADAIVSGAGDSSVANVFAALPAWIDAL